MTNNSSKEDRLTVAIAGLGAEFCEHVAKCSEYSANELLEHILKLLPRIYMTINDIEKDVLAAEDSDAIYGTLDEQRYETARMDMASLFGEYDTFLDAPMDDMQYSDTPIAASLSEKLADIYQQMFDLAYSVRQSPQYLWPAILSDLRERFDSYLSETICDALRVTNILYRKNVFNDGE